MLMCFGGVALEGGLNGGDGVVWLDSCLLLLVSAEIPTLALVNMLRASEVPTRKLVLCILLPLVLLPGV